MAAAVLPQGVLGALEDAQPLREELGATGFARVAGKVPLEMRQGTR